MYVAQTITNNIGKLCDDIARNTAHLMAVNNPGILHPRSIFGS